MDRSRQFCTFRLADLSLGIEVENIQEVIRYQAMTNVPLAPPSIRGLINLRGQLVTAIDLRSRLSLPPRSEGELPMNVVVRTGDAAVSFLVDEIGDVLEVQERDFERPPQTLRGLTRSLIRGVYKLETELLLILDTRQAMDVESTSH